MKVGTKSVLFGAHCFFIHPFFVTLAWWRLFGFPFDPRLWVAFFVHDLGYIGKPNMDGPEGEEHVWFGAKIMHRLFDRRCWRKEYLHNTGTCKECNRWLHFCLYHSRFYAKKDNQHFSRLCVADKLAPALEPKWLYLTRVKWSGEVYEYMQKASKDGEEKYASMNINTETMDDWYETVMAYLKGWVEAHKDMREDKWTPERKAL